MSTQSTLDSIITDVGGLSTLGASWYSAINPSAPIIVAGTPQQIAAQTAAIAAQNQATSQAALLANQPTLSGLLNNPTIVIVGIIALVLVFILLLRK